MGMGYNSGTRQEGSGWQERESDRRFILYLPSEVRREIDEIARGRFDSRADFIRQAIREKLDREHEAEALRKLTKQEG